MDIAIIATDLALYFKSAQQPIKCGAVYRSRTALKICFLSACGQEEDHVPEDRGPVQDLRELERLDQVHDAGDHAQRNCHVGAKTQPMKPSLTLCRSQTFRSKFQIFQLDALNHWLKPIHSFLSWVKHLNLATCRSVWKTHNNCPHLSSFLNLVWPVCEARWCEVLGNQTIWWRIFGVFCCTDLSDSVHWRSLVGGPNDVPQAECRSCVSRAMMMTACDLSAIAKPWEIQSKVGREEALQIGRRNIFKIPKKKIGLGKRLIFKIMIKL